MGENNNARVCQTMAEVDGNGIIWIQMTVFGPLTHKVKMKIRRAVEDGMKEIMKHGDYKKVQKKSMTK